MKTTGGATAANPSAVSLRGAVGPLPFSEHYHGPVWHFTDSSALVSIVSNRKLWATAATMLNDPKELIYGAKRIKRWYENHGGTLPQSLPLHVHLTEILSTDFVESILSDPAYVLCASTDYRILNQWRNYGGTKGVAVRLEPHADLVPTAPPMIGGFIFKPVWVKVVYDPQEQDDRIRRVLESITADHFKDTLASTVRENTLIRGRLAALAASMKDSAYAEEREVRLIAYLPENHPLKHRGSDRGVLPYIEISHYENFGWELVGLKGLGDPDAALPIMEVRVGPPTGASERQRIVGVESLLRFHGSPVPVNGSTIKYLPA